MPSGWSTSTVSSAVISVQVAMSLGVSAPSAAGSHVSIALTRVSEMSSRIFSHSTFFVAKPRKASGAVPTSRNAACSSLIASGLGASRSWPRPLTLSLMCVRISTVLVSAICFSLSARSGEPSASSSAASAASFFACCVVVSCATSSPATFSFDARSAIDVTWPSHSLFSAVCSAAESTPAHSFALAFSLSVNSRA